MAELALVIERPGKVTKYEDGDILIALNDRRILDAHAQNACHPKKMTFNSDGLRPANCLLEKYNELNFQYKFERISETEVRRTDLTTSVTDVISEAPNADGEAMHVEEFIKRRVKHPRHQVFGEEGSEYWFGGNSNMDLTKLGTIWTEIEKQTELKKADHTKWHFTDAEMKKYLVMPSDDFTNEERGELESPLMDETGDEPVMIKPRKNKIKWKDLSDIVEVDVLDISKKVELRETATKIKPLTIKEVKTISVSL